MTTHPPLPAPAPDAPRTSFHHKAAKYVFWALVLSFGLNLVSRGVFNAAGPEFDVARRVFGVLMGVVFVSVVPAGIIALCGIPKHGRKGLLGPGLTGILLPLLLVGMAVPAFHQVRSNALEMRARQQAQQLADELNTGAPKMLDEVTRLEGAKVDPAKTVTVSITLTGVAKSELDPALWQEKVVAAVKQNVETTALASLVKTGVTLVYRYTDRDGVLVDELVFRPEDFRTKK